MIDVIVSIRKCNGAREWIQDSNIPPKPEYECAAFGQDQYRTFDGKWISFSSTGNCEYQLMKINGKENDVVSVSNEECLDSLELQMCKKVLIETKKGDIELFQKTIKITLKDGSLIEYTPGDYPEPCSSSALNNVEIFSKGLFTIVRVFSPNDPFKPLYEVCYNCFNIFCTLQSNLY